jgi:hypothetical protein
MFLILLEEKYGIPNTREQDEYVSIKIGMAGYYVVLREQ